MSCKGYVCEEHSPQAPLCPLHAQAPAMYQALKLIAESENFLGGTFILELQQIARDILAKVEGGKP